MSQLLWTSLWTSSFGWIEIQIQFLKALYTFSIHELDNFQDWNFRSILITHQDPQDPQDLKFWDGGVICWDLFYLYCNWVICFILDVDIQRLDKVIQQKKQDI